MSKTRRTRNEKLEHLTNDFEKIKEIVVEEKMLLNVSNNTLKNYDKVFYALQEYFEDKVNPFELTSKDAKDFVRFLQNDKIHYKDKLRNLNEQRGLKESTINSYIKLAKTIYQTLLEEGYVESNPFRTIKCLKRQNERIKTIPKEDIKKLLTSLDNEYYTDFRMYVAVNVLLDTFGRIGEVLNIKIEDIDFENRTIFFPVTKNNDFRYVPFSKKTEKYILEFIDECRDMKSPYLFNDVNGNRWQEEAFRNSLKSYCEKFQIKTHITPHMFRHTASMIFLESGGNIRVLQKILGHRKLSTTEIYAHVSDDLIAMQKENYGTVDQIMNNKKYQRARSKRFR
ncbi:tyrosine-type recombinase/integrase [Macrococcoides caseolyticum]|uniref:tyrosine-type recombinase/integrase n=1 Tax=Macrococcoides caseolyticum TaxID=69966 RepID=UPI001F174B81|nr:tyrosine-type recombinase/integrase [Macrococcus caseolyticus]MCE4956737.1 tyrosine-type recombinase/integrase [Macrococcus caseolyticus]